ncbi:hypothetical protein, conserved [Trypanosoma brucei gambiense DAL972]|uniref:PH-like domain-containing protein n=1 Tax=Trypanosoma brucei gambiense (strain MHOM/CI/86/DAL972) TaxID=679716 RepID=C9ZYX1_TRYB9|nr:hypothetical protein, conserved [Trypanosoma brucei gambiense DAL972]CBH14620.1 hypothetical protein, conserved [Trypanosoma brucei gambiense DAL972]|eukprot:XP_011776886.1 hypothetical protein, conserved [Trypanosoma brucei gambiense DAL972]
MSGSHWMLAEMSGNLTWIKRSPQSDHCANLFSVLSPTLIVGYSEEYGTPLDYILFSTVLSVTRESPTIVALHYDGTRKLLLVAPSADDCAKWFQAMSVIPKRGVPEEVSLNVQALIMGKSALALGSSGISAVTSLSTPHQSRFSVANVPPISRGTPGFSTVDTSVVECMSRPQQGVVDECAKSADGGPVPPHTPLMHCGTGGMWSEPLYSNEFFRRQRSHSFETAATAEEQVSHRDNFYEERHDPRYIPPIAIDRLDSACPSMGSSTRHPSSRRDGAHPAPFSVSKTISLPHVEAILEDDGFVHDTEHAIRQKSFFPSRTISCPVVEVDDECDTEEGARFSETSPTIDRRTTLYSDDGLIRSGHRSPRRLSVCPLPTGAVRRRYGGEGDRYDDFAPPHVVTQSGTLSARHLRAAPFPFGDPVDCEAGVRGSKEKGRSSLFRYSGLRSIREALDELLSAGVDGDVKSECGAVGGEELHECHSPGEVTPSAEEPGKTPNGVRSPTLETSLEQMPVPTDVQLRPCREDDPVAKVPRRMSLCKTNGFEELPPEAADVDPKVAENPNLPSGSSSRSSSPSPSTSGYCLFEKKTCGPRCGPLSALESVARRRVSAAPNVADSNGSRSTILSIRPSTRVLTASCETTPTHARTDCDDGGFTSSVHSP